MGIWSATTSRPNFFWSDSIALSKEARSRSMRFKTNRTGRWNSCANFHIFSVWTSTPDTASHTIRTESAAETAARASGAKMP